MGKIVVTEFVTLDGVMEAPGGEPGHPHTGWVEPYMAEPGTFPYKEKETMDAEALLIGRVTYESFAGAWPSYEGRMADWMNSMPKHVVSTTLKDPGWANTSVISTNVVDSIRTLKEQYSGTILVAGSRTLVHTLFEHNLADVYRLFIAPVVVGSGDRIFPQTPVKSAFKLAKVETIGDVVIIDYQPI